MFVSMIRVRVSALVPTQQYGNVSLEAEQTIAIEDGDDPRLVTGEALVKLRGEIASEIASMDCDGATRWLDAVIGQEVPA